MNEPVRCPLRFGAYGGKTAVFVDAAANPGWSASLSSEADGWLTISASASGTGPGLVTLIAEKSTGAERRATLTVHLANRAIALVWMVTQASAEPLATLNASVLQVPFPTTPNVMELGIAGKYVAQQIAKMPPPADAVALAAVEAIIPVLGELLIALRQALSVVVPEPLTWFGAPEPYDALTLAMPATAVFISEEVALLDLYIPIEFAENG